MVTKELFAEKWSPKRCRRVVRGKVVWKWLEWKDVWEFEKLPLQSTKSSIKIIYKKNILDYTTVPMYDLTLIKILG